MGYKWVFYADGDVVGLWDKLVLDVIQEVWDYQPCFSVQAPQLYAKILFSHE